MSLTQRARCSTASLLCVLYTTVSADEVACYMACWLRGMFSWCLSIPSYYISYFDVCRWSMTSSVTYCRGSLHSVSLSCDIFVIADELGFSLILVVTWVFVGLTMALLMDMMFDKLSPSVVWYGYSSQWLKLFRPCHILAFIIASRLGCLFRSKRVEGGPHKIADQL